MGGKNKKKKSGGGGGGGGDGGGAPMATFAYDDTTSELADDNMTPAELKAKGNDSVKAGDHATAFKLFTQAIIKGPPADELHVFYSNRSLCAPSLKKFDMATQDAQKCVELKPDWSKGYSRLGSAHFFAGRFEEAAAAYGKGLAVEPTSEPLLQGLQAAKAELEKPAMSGNGKQPAVRAA